MGLVMMLTTSAWVPPSWETMLPQKFSAATTLTTRPAVAEPDAAVEAPLPQAASKPAIRAMAATFRHQRHVELRSRPPGRRRVLGVRCGKAVLFRR